MAEYPTGTFADSYGNRWESNDICLFCQRASGRFLFRLQNERYPFLTDISPCIVKCDICGLAWVSPRVVQVTRSKAKAEKETSASLAELAAHGMNLNQIEKFKAGGRLLDVGCGHGALLYEAEQRHWEAVGVEPNKEKARYASEKFGVSVFAGYLEDSDLPDDYFDVVVMEEVLEHLPNPFNLLLQVRRVLKGDGALFLTTPDIESFEARLLRERWVMLYVAGHIYFYSPTSLQRVLEQAGLTIWKRILYVPGQNRAKDLVKWLLTRSGTSINSLRILAGKRTETP